MSNRSVSRGAGSTARACAEFPDLRRQPAPQQLRYQHCAGGRQPSRVWRLPAGRDLLRSVPLDIGRRVDKFGNLDKPVFSPRVAFMVKPGADQTLTLSYNRAFRSPSMINNFLDMSIVQPVDLSQLTAFRPFLTLSAPGRPAADDRPGSFEAVGAAARPDHRTAVSAGRPRGRQRRAGRRRTAHRDHARVADGVRVALHRNLRTKDDSRSRRLPQPPG